MWLLFKYGPLSSSWCCFSTSLSSNQDSGPEYGGGEQKLRTSKQHPLRYPVEEKKSFYQGIELVSVEAPITSIRKQVY